MENGKWKMKNHNGKWKMENGKWKMENGKWKQKAVPVKADDADDAGRSSRTCTR